MVNLLPAVLVGGPPHAGKSVLFYRLTQALRAHGVDHYALRACPDGEGNWFHEGDPELMSTLRVKLTGEWPPAFVQSITQALEHRSLPFLVDMGGHPKASEACLPRNCTHSILLVREDKPEDIRLWEDFMEEHNLLPLARLISRQTGESIVTASTPLLEGIITGLERSAASGQAGAGPVFEELLARLLVLFTSYNLQERKMLHFEHAPTELVLDVQQELQAVKSGATFWEPAMLPACHARLPVGVPLSVYGPGPGWLYAALAAYTDPQPFYLYDPKQPFGWIPPVRVMLSPGVSWTEEMHVEVSESQEATILHIRFPHDRLNYLQPDSLPVPPVIPERGLIIDGRLPHWLLTALTRLYQSSGVAWIASFSPPLGKAVVVFSRQASPQPGDLVVRPGD